MQFSIIIPVSCNEGHIHNYYLKLKDYLSELKIVDYEVIFVFSNSSDISWTKIVFFSLSDKRIRSIDLANHANFNVLKHIGLMLALGKQVIIFNGNDITKFKDDYIIYNQEEIRQYRNDIPNKSRTEYPLVMIRKSVNCPLQFNHLKLSRLTEEDIELVRNWRNDPKIAENMNYREYITPEAQKNWFHSIDNEYNSYSIVENRERKIGLSNLKNIDYNNRCAEAGLFIYDEQFQHSATPIKISILGFDYAFGLLGLENIYIHVLTDNQRAVQYNLAWGFELQSGQENEKSQLYLLTRNNYYKHRKKFLDLLITDDGNFL